MIEQKIANEKELSKQYVEEAPYHPGYEDAAMRQEIKLYEPPVFVGCWIIGGSFSIFVKQRPTDEHIKHTIEYFGWEWKDGSFEEQLKAKNED